MYIQLITNALDVLIISMLFYVVYYFSRGTYTGTIVKGLFLAVLLYLGARFSNLRTVVWLFERFFSNITLILVILFHQEIRKSLSNIGRTFYKEKAHKSFITMLAENLFSFSEQKTGALIIIERSMNLNEFVKNGVRLNAEYSVELMDTIFNKNTVLHDGAVIIRKEKILAAHVFLPTISQSDQVNGTRHAAALSISHDRDCLVFIVSEETGSVSYARGGIISPIPNEVIEEVLNEILA
ncbi:MAG: diadenylate cyclase [Brevinema sp.]